MADWSVTQDFFGTYAGPVPVLLAFRIDTGHKHIGAIDAQIELHSARNYFEDDDVEQVRELMRDNLDRLFAINTSAKDMWLVVIPNERDIRDECNKTLIRLLSDGDLIGVFQMYPSDFEALVELDCHRMKKVEISAICDHINVNSLRAIECCLTRIANDPKCYFVAFDELFRDCRYNAYYYAGNAGLTINTKNVIAYEGPYDEIVALLCNNSNSSERIKGIAERELQLHYERIKTVITGLKII